MSWNLGSLLLPLVGATLLGATTVGAAPRPAPELTAITNAASYTTDVAKGSIAIAWGRNFSDEQCWGSLQQLENKLPVCGTEIRAGGEPLPIFYVGPHQINFQAPHATGHIKFVVSRDGAQSNEVGFAVLPRAPGVFAFTEYGREEMTNKPFVRHERLAAAQKVNAALILPESALKLPADGSCAFVTLYGTGAGEPATEAAPAIGERNPGGAVPIQASEFFLNGERLADDQIPYQGLAPEYVGLHQFNICLKKNGTPRIESGAYSLVLRSGGVASQPVTILVTESGEYVVGSLAAIALDDTPEGRAALAAAEKNVSGKITNVRTGAEALFVADENRNFLHDLPNGRGMHEVQVLGKGFFYNWRSTINASGASRLADAPVQMLPIVEDPNSVFDYHRDVIADINHRPELVVWTAGSKPMDLLDFLDYMQNYASRSGGTCPPTVRRWLFKDGPEKIYIPAAGARQYTTAQGTVTGDVFAKQAFEEIDARLGTTLLEFADHDLLAAGGDGLTLVWGMEPGHDAVSLYRERDGIACVAPTKAHIYIDPALFPDPEELKRAIKHEWGVHGLLGPLHSPSRAHNSHEAAPVEPSVFETYAQKAVTKMRLKTDWTRLYRER